jgi:hypothetical protein
VDAPVPIRHEKLTSARNCPGFWIRSNEPRRHEHGAASAREKSSAARAIGSRLKFLHGNASHRQIEPAAYLVTTVAFRCDAGTVQQHWHGKILQFESWRD